MFRFFSKTVFMVSTVGCGMLAGAANPTDISSQSRELWDFCQEHRKDESLDRARQLLKQGADANVYAGSCLEFAAASGDAKLVNLLITHGAKANRTGRDPLDHSLTALQWAAMKGFREICEMLIKAGADVNYQACGNWGMWGENIEYSALHWAASYGHANVCEVLIREGAHANIRAHIDERVAGPGSIPLDAAKAAGKEDVVKLLRAVGGVGRNDLK